MIQRHSQRQLALLLVIQLRLIDHYPATPQPLGFGSRQIGTTDGGRQRQISVDAGEIHPQTGAQAQGTATDHARGRQPGMQGVCGPLGIPRCGRWPDLAQHKLIAPPSG